MQFVTAEDRLLTDVLSWIHRYMSIIIALKDIGPGDGATVLVPGSTYSFHAAVCVAVAVAVAVALTCWLAVPCAQATKA